MFPNQNSYDGMISVAAARYGVPFALLKAIIAQESNFVQRAYRAEPSVGDASYGLMQLLSGTARGLGYGGDASGLYDPQTNINLGASYVAALMRDAQAGGWGLDSVMSSYNGGESGDRPGDGKRDTSREDGYADDGSGGLAPFINQSYVDAVSRYMQSFSGGPVAAASGSPTAVPGGGMSGATVAVLAGAGVVLALLFGARR